MSRDFGIQFFLELFYVFSSLRPGIRLSIGRLSEFGTESLNFHVGDFRRLFGLSQYGHMSFDLLLELL